MIDIHSHILPSLDDGPTTVGESLVILRQSIEQGIDTIVCTPHYIKESNTSLLTKDVIDGEISKLKLILKEEDIKINILSGSEVMIFKSLGRDLKNGLISTINNSKYVLVEFPSREIPAYTINVFYDLYHMGYKPIICHPERNIPIMKDPNILYDYIKNDWVLAQVNSSSLLGLYGSKVQKAAETLARHNLIHFIASDCHSIGKRAQNLKDGVKALSRLIGDKKTNTIVNNSYNIINNKEAEVFVPVKLRKNIISIAKKALSI